MITPLKWQGNLYQIECRAITAGLRGANVRVEKRLDGSMAVRHGARYLPVHECTVAVEPKAASAVEAAKARRAVRRVSDWNKNFDMKKGPKIWQAAQASGSKQSAT